MFERWSGTEGMRPEPKKPEKTLSSGHTHEPFTHAHSPKLERRHAPTPNISRRLFVGGGLGALALSPLLHHIRQERGHAPKNYPNMDDSLTLPESPQLPGSIVRKATLSSEVYRTGLREKIPMGPSRYSLSNAESALPYNQLNRGHITINEEARNALYTRYYQIYDKGGKLHKDLLRSIEKMHFWIGGMVEEFRKRNVPEKFVYLTIPESHFLTADRDVSPANAKGYYQIIDDTARKTDATKDFLNNIVDNRYDPIRSAAACAEILQYLFKNSNNDWDLALSGYNGGLIWGYFKETPLKKRTYSGYCAYLEKIMNKKLAQSHRKNPTALLSNELENLTYPAKFYAIFDVIVANNLIPKPGDGTPSLSYRILTLDPEKNTLSLSEVARAFGLDVDELSNLNGRVRSKKNKLPPGIGLRIPVQQ